MWMTVLIHVTSNQCYNLECIQPWTFSTLRWHQCRGEIDTLPYLQTWRINYIVQGVWKRWWHRSLYFLGLRAPHFIPSTFQSLQLSLHSRLGQSYLTDWRLASYHTNWVPTVDMGPRHLLPSIYWCISNLPLWQMATMGCKDSPEGAIHQTLAPHICTGAVWSK